MTIEIPENLSYSQIVLETEKMRQRGEQKRRTDMDGIINDFLSKAKEYQYSVNELVAEIRKKLEVKPSKAVKKAEVNGAIVGWDQGVTYANPENPSQTWVGGKRGPKPIWLVAQFKEGGLPEEMAKKFLTLKKSS